VKNVAVALRLLTKGNVQARIAELTNAFRTAKDNTEARRKNGPTRTHRNANEFAMFQQTEGTATGTAQVLFADHSSRGQLSSWDWDYLLDAGDSYALYPKSWFDCRWEKFPAHIVLEQFSPILPDNYRESGFPVAVYRWHAENTATQTVTVTILCSWTNMLGWFRTFCRDFRHARGGS
jgi:non-lysosomal glucosylceramidase